MRLLTVLFCVLAGLIQIPLWWMDGGWFTVWERERELASLRSHNELLRQRNATLSAEVDDLRDGTAAIEERARYELGMIRSDEIFVQLVEPSASPKAAEKTAQQ